MDFKIETFLFDTPIYNREKIDSQSEDFLLIFYSHLPRNIEGYNPWRKVNSTFSIIRNLTHSNREMFEEGGIGTIKIQCKRYHDEFTFFVYWFPKEKNLIKIGQFPSVADFHIGEIKQYNGLISEERLKEFTRAIGLAANGVGIGSFVYLRRTFEHLINEAFELANSAGVINEADFYKSRMDEKIELLHSFLPNFLVENKSMYSILSLGIHELDENTCLDHFDTLRVGIEIILDEKLDEKRKREKIDEAKKKLSAIRGTLKK